jgi:hypothetical protein
VRNSLLLGTGQLICDEYASILVDGSASLGGALTLRLAEDVVQTTNVPIMEYGSLAAGTSFARITVLAAAGATCTSFTAAPVYSTSWMGLVVTPAAGACSGTVVIGGGGGGGVNLPLAIGLSIGLLILCVIITVILCCICNADCLCNKRHRKKNAKSEAGERTFAVATRLDAGGLTIGSSFSNSQVPLDKPDYPDSIVPPYPQSDFQVPAEYAASPNWSPDSAAVIAPRSPLSLPDLRDSYTRSQSFQVGHTPSEWEMQPPLSRAATSDFAGSHHPNRIASSPSTFRAAPSIGSQPSSSPNQQWAPVPGATQPAPNIAQSRENYTRAQSFQVTSHAESVWGAPPAYSRASTSDFHGAPTPSSGGTQHPNRAASSPAQTLRHAPSVQAMPTAAPASYSVPKSPIPQRLLQHQGSFGPVVGGAGVFGGASASVGSGVGLGALGGDGGMPQRPSQEPVSPRQMHASARGSTVGSELL